MRGILAAVFVSVSAAAAVPFEAPTTVEALDARIDATLKGSPVVGVQVALVDRSGAVWAKAYGHLDIERSRPARNASIFRAGSISKSVTGVLAQMLVEDGALDLNARLIEAVPAIAFQNKWEASDPVRLVHLAEHTTGWDDIHFSEYKSFAPGITLIAGLGVNPKSRTARWRPGRYASYCNAGPSALAAAIEAATGRSFEALVDERIFGPLAIEKASFQLTDEIAADLSRSYTPAGAEEPYTHIAMRPAGSLNISAIELAKFVAFLIRRGEAGGIALVSPEGVERIERPTTSLAARAGLKLGYGLGVYGSPIEDRIFYGHTGGIDGFIAQYGYSKELQTGFVIMSNTAAGEQLIAVRKLVVAHLIAMDGAPPAPQSAASVSDLSPYEGWYRLLTPNLEFTRLLTDVFDVRRIKAKDGALEMTAGFSDEATRLVPMGGGLFAKDGRGQADRVFLTTPEGALEMHDFFQSAYRKVGAMSVYGRIAFVGAVALAAALALLSTLVWIALRPFGVFRHSNRWRVWTFPLLSLASFAAAGGVLTAAASGGFADTAARLGAPTPWSIGVLAATILGPALAAFGLGTAVLARRVARLARLQAGLTALILTALGAYMWHYGWVGLEVWSYQPKVFGQ